MSKKQKKLVVVAAALALCFGIVPTANAMHIMEGYLPPHLLYCLGRHLCSVPAGRFFQNQ